MQLLRSALQQRRWGEGAGAGGRGRGEGSQRHNHPVACILEQ